MRKLSDKALEIITDTELVTSNTDQASIAVSIPTDSYYCIEDDETTDPSEIDMENDGDDGLPDCFDELDGMQC